MNSNSIREWLNSGRNFNTGVALFATYGQDALLKRVFAQGQSAYRAEQLEKALRALMEQAERPAISEREPEHKAVAVADEILPEHAVKAEDDPYRAKWLPHYIQMNHLRHTLIHIKDDKERGVAAHEVLRLERLCKKYWKMRDYYHRTGNMMEDPEDVAPQLTDMNKVQKRINNLRSSVSKWKKKVKNAGQESQPGMLLKLDEYKAELKSLEEILGNG